MLGMELLIQEMDLPFVGKLHLIFEARLVHLTSVQRCSGQDDTRTSYLTHPSGCRQPQHRAEI